MDMMLMRRFAMLQQSQGGCGLPDAYQQVEWIASTTNTGQYIDTGVAVTSDIHIKARWMFTAVANYQAVYGAKGAVFDLQRYVRQSYLVVDTLGASTRITQFSGIENLLIDSEQSMSDVVLNGTSYAISAGTTEPSGTIWLFGKEKSTGGAIDVKGACRIYSAQILYGSTLQRNFIPCYRKSDNVIGMYDTVTNTFYTNAGTGTFAIPT